MTMKQETKETVKFIKDILKGYKIHVETDNFLEADDKSTELINIKTAFDFLDSLPEIESHLCRGGYIQDRNGTPCCDGDEVIVSGDNKTFMESEVGTLKGVLQWEKNHFSIVFPTGKKNLVMYLDTFAGFEKVK